MLDQLLNNKETLYLILMIVGIILFLILVFLIILEKKFKVKYAKIKSLPNSNTLEDEFNLKKDHGNNIEEQNEVVEDKTTKINLEQVLEKMQESLEGKHKDPIRSFEEEQEESAIISYQELLKANGRKVLPIPPKEEQEESAPTEIIKNDKSTEIKKFKNSEFISPIYGRIDNEVEYPKIPNFRKREEISKEPIIEEEETVIERPVINKEVIDKNEKFLSTLKEFRKNLE